MHAEEAGVRPWMQKLNDEIKTSPSFLGEAAMIRALTPPGWGTRPDAEGVMSELVAALHRHNLAGGVPAFQAYFDSEHPHHPSYNTLMSMSLDML